jgi:hypothetical protein
LKKHALLLRLNPTHWPLWDKRLVAHSYSDIWFTTGRRRVADIRPGMPVVVLGTDNLGVVACGETSSFVESRPDPDWKESPPKYQAVGKEPKNRVCVRIRRASVPLLTVQEQSLIANLYRTARETTTWLSEEQYQVFYGLISQLQL